MTEEMLEKKYLKLQNFLYRNEAFHPSAPIRFFVPIAIPYHRTYAVPRKAVHPVFDFFFHFTRHQRNLLAVGNELIALKEILNKARGHPLPILQPHTHVCAS